MKTCPISGKACDVENCAWAVKDRSTGLICAIPIIAVNVSKIDNLISIPRNY